MKTYRLLFLIVVGLIILLPSGAVKALTIGGINVTEVTSGDGLYSDSYTGRYVYKGADVDNYITFNDELWRIIAIESDGTLKIMRNDSIGDMQFDPVGNRTEKYCSLGYAPSYGCNAWAAMDYFSIEGIHYGKVTEDSYLNAYLNEDYYNSLSSTAQSLIVSYTYNIGGVALSGARDTSYTISNQLTDESAYQWTGKVALINLSDYIKSNSSEESYCDRAYGSYNNYETCRNTTWMYSGSNYWTITPNGSYTYMVWFVRSFGYVRNDYAYNSHGVYPVVHITTDLKLSGTMGLKLSGSGTFSDPYTIVQTDISDTAGETTDDTSVQVVNVPATSQSVPFIILLGGFAIIIVALIVIIAVTKSKKIKSQK